MEKFAVLSMDVEEWYHLDYFKQEQCNQKQSTLDGLHLYLEILNQYQIKTTFFVVGEIIEKIIPQLKKIIENGHEIGLHTYSHQRPLSMSLEEFRKDTTKTIETIREKLNYGVKGFRAPCFSLDKERLNILQQIGLKYDASKINFSDHKLYGNLDVSDFNKIELDIFKKNDFFEFETSTVPLNGKNIPISGGGYLRIFPWFLTKTLLKKYFKTNGNYFFYIHPFEFSKNFSIKVPSETGFLTKIRFRRGRKSVESKTHQLIKLLKKNNYKFVTFEDLLKRYSGK